MTMLENMARAICRVSNPLAADRYIEARWSDYRPQAKAALDSLLHPDEGTIEAMRSAYLVTTREGLADTDMAAAWKAGVDHILKGGE